MMKLTAFILLSYALCLTTAFRGSSLVIDTKRNPFESSTGNRYASHVQKVRTRSSYHAINPESAEYQESIKESFTVVTNNPSTKTNYTSVLSGINILQACTAGLCVAGRLPILNSVMSFALGKGLCLAGLAVMGLAWNQTRNNNDESEEKIMITTGLYSHVRHPFLAGQWMVLIGFAGCWKQSPMRYFLAGLYYLVLRKKVEIEEKKMERQFGHEYQVYKVLVKGQLIPNGISSMFDT